MTNAEIKKTTHTEHVKDTILKSYRQVLAEKNGKLGLTLPEDQLLKKHNAEILDTALHYAAQDIEAEIGNVKKDYQTIKDFIESFTTYTFEKFEKAIDIKNQEFVDLAVIEEAFFNLFSGVKSQQLYKEDVESQIAEKEAALKLELNQLKDKVKKETLEIEENFKLNSAESKKQRKIQEQEFAYKCGQDQKMLQDYFNDGEAQMLAHNKEQIKELEKQNTEKKIRLDAQEERLIKEEKGLEVLKEQIKNYEDIIGITKVETEKQCIAEVTKKLAIKESYLKKDFEIQIEVLNKEIASLQEVAKNFEQKNKELLEKLDSAYEKTQNIALKTVETHSK